MSEAEQTVDTVHGRLDRRAFEQVRDSFDTTTLLRLIDELDALVAQARGEEGLRDQVLRLHAMAHTIINGAGLSAPTDRESLPELALEVTSQLHEAIGALQSWVRRITPLVDMAADD